ncbi:ATP-dependent helicase rhp16-like isoform X2 [Phragmites australis]|uniref:ATP-dependent helicase rhp16-like isoform X2 n=1 Tax=Phragmites australis TaxID=29695 RepID=UPI002D770D6E|nr:ATP-dependent helicase rhp16-like isoform X2 [Phragmites australis]
MPRRTGNPSSGSSSRRRRRDEEEDEFPSDDTADSDFVVDSKDEAKDEDEDEGFAPDADGAPAVAVAALPPPSLPPRKGKGRRSKKARDEDTPPMPWEEWEVANDKWLDGRMAADVGVEASESPEAAAGSVPTAEPAPEVVLPLLRFQKEWLAWALVQEASPTRGGILADEMGMGKTIQAISLVVTARRLRPPGQQAAASSSAPRGPPMQRVGCTLVICPVVAVIQWVQEIERHTAKGSVRVLLHHGAKRGTQKFDFDNYDFVITTYSTIEADYRKHIMPPKSPCDYCNKLLDPSRMKVHLKYYCGPDAQRTEKQAKQQSKKWGSKKAKGKRRGHKKDGGDELGTQSRGMSPLHMVWWKRIILDEAHFIKDRRCNTARAVFALESEYKWALSGTPLQNRVGELYSLIRFLQIFPYSNYFCKDCNCEVLDTRMKKFCECGHSTVRHFCWWNKYISKPIQWGSASDEGQRAMVLLKEKVLKGIVLRRTKKGRAADLALPPKIVTLRRDSFDKNEMEFYEALYTQSCTQFDSYVVAGTLMNNYAHIFDLLTRLRQAVDHPYLVAYSKTAKLCEGLKNEGMESQCGICHNMAEDHVVTSCDHVFCKTCLIDYSATLGNVSCPSCSKPLTVDLTTQNSGEKVTPNAGGRKCSGILGRLESLADFKTSTKIDALREEVRNMIEHDGSAKGIVFSQFTSFLDLIQFSLEKSGIKCVQLNGAMNIAEKRRAIDTFTDDPDCRIFLMSLKAGGVALNLTVASHVFLMDPWWNPAVESQAQDRIHRIGQFKPIRSVRFVIKDTVEERILQLQEKKRLVFEGTVGDSPEAMSKLT